MLTRVITALVMIVTCVPCLLFGGWFYLVAMIVMAALSVYEFIAAPNKGSYGILIYILVFLMETFFIFSVLFLNKDVRNGIVNDHIFVLNTLYISVFEIVFYFLILMMFALFSTVFTVHDAFYLFSMGVYIGITYICMLFLRYLPNSSMFYAEEGLKSSLLADFTVVGAVMNDVGAYFVGVLLGKHKMAPRVSPNKTWEGFFGGIIFSVSFSLTFAWLTDYYGYPILPGILSWSNYWWRILIMSLVMPIAGDFGDLMFSLIKRAFAIKDYGTLLPGHGGVLDRIDGLSVIVIVNVIFILGFLYGSEVLLWL